jgi:hypothetical protein
MLLTLYQIIVIVSVEQIDYLCTMQKFNSVAACSKYEMSDNIKKEVRTMQPHKTNTVKCLLLLSTLIGVESGGCGVGSHENRLKIQHEAESIAPTVGSIEVTANIQITDIPYKLSAFKKAGFSKYVNVFGIHIFSTPRTPDAKVLHVANVMAQYLDNNEDGVPDNLLVLSHLVSRNAYFVFPADEDEFETMDPELWNRADYHFGQFQHAEETRPEFLVRGEIQAEDEWEYDASLEEVLHLITQHGYANAYPSAFAEEKGSAIANCLDDARGGYFKTVPTNGPHYGYPEGSWFHYNDETCEYGCMITEYFYWALTSILGTQDYEGRSDALKNEWELNTRKLVKSGDPNIYALLTDPQYKLPTRAPDGDYNPSALTATLIPLIAVEGERDMP